MGKIARVPFPKLVHVRLCWLSVAFIAFAFCFLTACASPSAAEPAFPAPTIYPTQPQPRPIVITNTPEPTFPTSEFDGVWRAVKPGIEYMLLQDSVNGQLERLVVARIDSRLANLRVLYDPESPRTVHDWYRYTGADLVVNGGFFDEANKAIGLLISDGQTFGRSFRGFGGMFSLRGDQPTLQWLKTQPHRPDTSVTQAVQSFPMLVLDSRVVDGISDDDERNRRSFVALDKDGFVLLGVCQTVTWTLTDLAQYLATSPPLGVARALNLDGGTSSGIWIKDAPEPVLSDSFEAVPSVIAVSDR